MAGLRRILVSLSIVWATVLVAAGPARAEEPAVVKALLDGFELRTQLRPTYQSIDTGSDGTITVKGLAFTFAEGLDLRYDIDTVTLKGVVEVGDNRFEVMSADASGVSFSFDGQTVVAIPAVQSTGIFVRGLPQSPSDFDRFMAGSTIAREMTIPRIVILIAEKSLTMENVHATFEGDPWAYNGTQRMTISRLGVPEDILTMAGEEVPFAQLGYTSMEFSSDSTMQFDMSGPSVSMGFDMGFTGKNMGTLRMVGNFADIPFELLRTASSEPALDEEQMIALAANISVSGLKVGFVDGSLTDRLIDFFAATQNMDRAQIITTAAAWVQIGLLELKNQNFTNKAIAAVNAFLTAPGSIYLLAAALPIRIEQFMQAGEDPMALVSLLQVDVQANQ
jgi:hypothetical protein